VATLPSEIPRKPPGRPVNPSAKNGGYLSNVRGRDQRATADRFNAPYEPAGATMSDKTPPYSDVYLGGDSVRLAKSLAEAREDLKPGEEGPFDTEAVALERATTLPLGSEEHLRAAPASRSEPPATGAPPFGLRAPPINHGTAPVKVTTARPPRPNWAQTGSVIAFLIALSAIALYFALEPDSSMSVPIAAPLPTETAKTVALPTTTHPPMLVAPRPTRTAVPVSEATDAIAAVAPPFKVGASFPARPAEGKARGVDAPRRQAIAFPAAGASATTVPTTRQSPISSGDPNPFPAGTSHF
jgi:hypothetical protein